MSAADQYIYTWLTSTGEPLLQSNLDVPDRSSHPGAYMHYKLITGLSVVQCPGIYDPLLLSVGMDRLLRISNLYSFEVLHQERLASPCTALGVFVS